MKLPAVWVYDPDALMLIFPPPTVEDVVATVKTEFKVEQLTAELKKLEDKTKERAESKGFNIQDKEIDGKKYISFSVKEYLERMIPPL